MPELPEVETTRRGILPHIENRTVTDVVIRNRKLRWPIPATLKKQLTNCKIDSVVRRGKYLLLGTVNGTAIIHLGMSGSIRICSKKDVPGKHDHFDFVFNNGKVLRYTDPRRFGCLLWTKSDPLKHKLLIELGPEPLSDEFNPDYLYVLSRKRKVNIKSLIMNSKIVTGVGNIYACESLFLAGINPKKPADKLSRKRYEKLVEKIKQVLQQAIKQGGTTLKDFSRADGKPGYFKQSLNVYGRTDEACPTCSRPIQQIVQNQRSTFFCKQCQK